MSVSPLVRPAAPSRPAVDPADIILAADVAELLQCSEGLVYSLARRGKLPAYRIPGTKFVRFLRTEILEAMRNSPAIDNGL